MSAMNTKELAESSRSKLKTAIEEIEQFLNANALPQLVQDHNEQAVSFYSGLLSDMRHLLVFSEVAYEKLGAVLRRPNFDIELAERALYEVYHNGVNSFFYPRNECYSEDGRYAYTGQDAIRFRTKPVRAARDVVLSISRVYEELRDDLSYYESDYLTHRRMQGQSK
ncbi:MAG: DUF3907 family protein [Candidatus Cohnella colombiensis]|uniref:DUF3907 family protein n=1 Tax=Candidatus Cohnella colombiensis TaxID=3121368 RepID=A0AA95JAH9_9BACL|nr:MAG: DUF3907 family protein [Cohnella sp.]